MLEKLTLLNKTILDNLNQNSNLKIVKAFTEVGVEILGANFGFAWFNESLENKEWVLVYKTPNSPFHPIKPRIDGRHYKVITSRKIYYQKKLTHAHDANFLSKHMKSFVIIPIAYREKAYGTIALCFKKEELFSKDKKILCEFLGNGIAQVITGHRSRERAERLKETEILLAQEKLKTEFIANATHELRTPLAIIRGNIDLALMNIESKRKVSPEKALSNINKEVAHLSNIISTLALISSKSGRLQNEINYKKINLSKLMNKLVERLKSVSVKKNISIKTKMSKDIILEGDESILVKLFSNLLRNAIIYGKQNGWINIHINKKAASIEVIVSDNGIGIDANDLPYIFERFYRADKSRNSESKRTGLGLSIAKWAADIHKGTISVTSKTGKGSTFKVSLPITHSIK